MTKAELIEAIADKAELSKKDADKALGAFIDTVTETLKDGDTVNIVGFGTFELRERAARTGKNPQTGEDMDIAASKVPALKIGKAYKALFND